MKINWHSLTPVGVGLANWILSPQVLGTIPAKYSPYGYLLATGLALVFPKLIHSDTPTG